MGINADYNKVLWSGFFFFFFFLKTSLVIALQTKRRVLIATLQSPTCAKLNTMRNR
jgi:hypothetical protein